MAKVITVTNQKGGVGKTTSSVHLALAIKKANPDSRVAVIDLDAQGHSTLFLSGDMELRRKEGGASLLFEAPADLKPVMTPAGIALYHGHDKLGALDEGEYTSEDAIKLKDYIRSLPYDYIIIDTPPALGLRQFASVIWADVLLVVSDTGQFALTGIAAVKGMVDMLRVNNLLDKNFAFRVIFNKFNPKNVQDSLVYEKFRSMYGDDVVEQTLPFSEAFKTVEMQREPIWELTYMPRRIRDLFLSLPVHIGVMPAPVTTEGE